MMQYLIEVLVRVGQSGLCSGFDGWHPYKLDESHRVWTFVKWNPTRPVVCGDRGRSNLSRMSVWRWFGLVWFCDV